MLTDLDAIAERNVAKTLVIMTVLTSKHWPILETGVSSRSTEPGSQLTPTQISSGKVGIVIPI